MKKKNKGEVNLFFTCPHCLHNQIEQIHWFGAGSPFYFTKETLYWDGQCEFCLEVVQVETDIKGLRDEKEKS